MNRIEALLEFIDQDDKVVDVGCDQAKLGLMLCDRGQYSIGVDISENVISRARHDIGNNKYIDLRVGNGLSCIKKDEADTLVLAGMGSHLIIKIVNESHIRFKKIITISNNHHDYLRSNMNKNGYIVDSELIVYEKGKYYNLICFKNGSKTYSEEELIFGLNHKDKNMYLKYLTYLYEKYNNINIKANNKNKKIIKYIKMINIIRENIV